MRKITMLRKVIGEQINRFKNIWVNTFAFGHLDFVPLLLLHLRVDGREDGIVGEQLGLPALVEVGVEHGRLPLGRSRGRCLLIVVVVV